MRKNIFEILESKYDINNEFDVIMKLFAQPCIVIYPQYNQG